MPAISVLGTDYASVNAWWSAEQGNDYGGAGPILEVPAGAGVGLTGDLQFRFGSVSQITIRAVSGAEYDGNYSSTTGKAVLDCGGFELDFRESNILFENIILKDFTTDSTGDDHNGLTIRRCMVDGYWNLNQGNTATGMVIEDSQVVLNSGGAQSDSVVYLLGALGLTIQRSTLINKAGGTSYGVLRNRSTSALTLNRNVVYSPSNDSYDTTGATPPAPTAADNCASDNGFPGSTITNLTSAVFVDYANGDYRILSTSGPATQTNPAGAFIQAATPTVIDVDGDNIIEQGQTDVVINASAFPASVTSLNDIVVGGTSDGSTITGGTSMLNQRWNDGNPMFDVPAGLTLGSTFDVHVSYTE